MFFWFCSIGVFVGGGNVACVGVGNCCVVFVGTGVVCVLRCCANVGTVVTFGDCVCGGVVIFSAVGGGLCGCDDACSGGAAGGRCGCGGWCAFGDAGVVDDHGCCGPVGSVGVSLLVCVGVFCWSS